MSRHPFPTVSGLLPLPSNLPSNIIWNPIPYPVVHLSPLIVFKTPPFLFHYTNHIGMSSILEHQYIRKSYPGHSKSSACYGEGVYLTAIPPEAADHIILRNNWKDDGLSCSLNLWNGSRIAKLQYCFCIPTQSLYPWALEKKCDNMGRDIWLYKCGITLADKKGVYVLTRWG